jgi:photosystem II stability/assembly factor-like uncharacterized protein
MYSFVLLLVLLNCIVACAPDTNLLGSGSWQASTLTNQHIRTLAVDPISPQTLYAANADGTTFRSRDAGQHWTKRGNVSATPRSLSMLTVIPSGNVLYALTAAGLFASTDAAQTWHAVNTANSGLPIDGYTTLTFNAQKNMYVGTSHHGVFMSSDSTGTRWKAINGTLPRAIVINALAFDGTQHRLWAATSSGVYRSDNDGTTWKALNNGLPVIDGVTTIQPAASAGGAPGLVYAGTAHGIFRSTDGGTHWIMSGQLLQGVPILHILIDFRSTNASTVYVGTKFGAFRSDDDGQNWRGVAGGLPENTPVNALAIGGNKVSQLYATANNVYLFPGSSSGINPTRVVTLLLILLLFVLLFFIAQRGARRRKALLKPLRNTDIPPSA